MCALNKELHDSFSNSSCSAADVRKCWILNLYFTWPNSLVFPNRCTVIEICNILEWIDCNEWNTCGSDLNISRYLMEALQSGKYRAESLMSHIKNSQRDAIQVLWPFM